MLGSGWSWESIRNYKALENIGETSWDIIGTSFVSPCNNKEDDRVPQFGTNVPDVFSEGLLRNILSLKPPRQYDLVWSLANGKSEQIFNNFPNKRSKCFIGFLENAKFTGRHFILLKSLCLLFWELQEAIIISYSRSEMSPLMKHCKKYSSLQSQNLLP